MRRSESDPLPDGQMAEMTSASPDPLSGSTIGVSPVRVGALSVHPVTLDQTLRFFQRMVDADSKATVLYANAHAVNLASQNPLFADCFDQANLVFCDGKAVQWASRLLGTPLPERFTPPDWIDQLCDLCASRSWRLSRRSKLSLARSPSPSLPPMFSLQMRRGGRSGSSSSLRRPSSDSKNRLKSESPNGSR